MTPHGVAIHGGYGVTCTCTAVLDWPLGWSRTEEAAERLVARHNLACLPDGCEGVEALRAAAADVRQSHAPNEYDSCVTCRHTWPCDAEMLAELVMTHAGRAEPDR